MQRVLRQPAPRLDASADVVIVGAGACGLVAALRARARGADVIVLERDASPSGSTAMSSGFVPAAGTQAQRKAGITGDNPQMLLDDILAKSGGKSDPFLADLASRTIAPAMDWLASQCGIEWIVLDDFLYPGHARHRMHAVPEKTGAALHARLLAAAQAADVALVTGARAERLYMDDSGRVTAVEIARPGGGTEYVGCSSLVLACNGFGANRELVRQHIPQIAGGLYYGHPGNTGDAVLWGAELGAELRHLSGYQGHGSLAHPHGILISWALMSRGAIQVNLEGRRFSNESGGYSEQAVHVLAQPQGLAWNIYDAQIHAFALSFTDYREAVAAGAIRTAPDIAGLCAATGLPRGALEQTLEESARLRAGKGEDPLGRDFAGLPRLSPPYHAVKVTGALFHTQGGLMIDAGARVLRSEGGAFPNLYAAGGAACGVSGPDVSGYLSGNGLLSAVAFGYLAGDSAASAAKA
jgi:flavocytochrome c